MYIDIPKNWEILAIVGARLVVFGAAVKPRIAAEVEARDKTGSDTSDLV